MGGKVTPVVEHHSDAALRLRTGDNPARYRRYGLRIAEYWLDQRSEPWTGADVALLVQYSDAPARAWSRPFSSLVIALDRTEQELRDGLNRDTKYKINRATERDEGEFRTVPADAGACGRFADFYDRFATSKGLAVIDRKALLARASAGLLALSVARWRGEDVVWHVHVCAGGAASLLHSASLFRSMDDKEAQAAIGRLNRALHWFDMLHFRALGLLRYDFGGWYAGNEDEGLLRINRFKEGFGGTRVDQFRALVGLTVPGRALVAARRMLARARE